MTEPHSTDRGRYRSLLKDYASLIPNIGRKDRVLPADVVGIVNRATRGSNVNIGRIDIGQIETRVQVEASAADVIAASVRGQTFRSRKLQIERQESWQHAKPGGRPGGYKGKQAGR